MMMLLHCMQDCICPLPSLLGRRKGKKRSKLLFSSVAHAFFIVAVSFQDQVLRVKGAKFTLRLNLIDFFFFFYVACSPCSWLSLFSWKGFALTISLT